MRLQDWCVLFSRKFQFNDFFNTTYSPGMTFSSSDLRPGSCPGHAVAEGNKIQQNNINYAGWWYKIIPFPTRTHHTYHNLRTIRVSSLNSLSIIINSLQDSKPCWLRETFLCSKMLLQDEQWAHERFALLRLSQLPLLNIYSLHVDNKKNSYHDPGFAKSLFLMSIVTHCYACNDDWQTFWNKKNTMSFHAAFIHC